MREAGLYATMLVVMVTGILVVAGAWLRWVQPRLDARRREQAVAARFDISPEQLRAADRDARKTGHSSGTGYAQTPVQDRIGERSRTIEHVCPVCMELVEYVGDVVIPTAKPMVDGETITVAPYDPRLPLVGARLSTMPWWCPKCGRSLETHHLVRTSVK